MSLLYLRPSQKGVCVGNNRPFKAGLVLETMVSRALTTLDVDHRRTAHKSPEDVQEALDFIVPRGHGRLPLEIQLTLQTNKRQKIFMFAFKSLTQTVRGVRLYIEVVGSHRRSADLQRVGERIARAIAHIKHRFRNFGPPNLLGLRIHAITGKIEKFDVLALCGAKLEQAVEWWKIARRREQEALEAARLAQIQEHLIHASRARQTTPFWKTIFAQLVRVNPFQSTPVLSCVDHRPAHPVNLHPLFMPRRFC